MNHHVVIIPYGGGTSVSEALMCPVNEQRYVGGPVFGAERCGIMLCTEGGVDTMRRMIVSLDMHEMNRIRWIDHNSMLACIEAGVVGKDLDAKLAKLGLVCKTEL